SAAVVVSGRVFVFQPGIDYIERRQRLLHRGIGQETSNYDDSRIRTTLSKSIRRETYRNGHIGIEIELKIPRQYADYRVALVVKRNQPAHDRRVGVEATIPNGMTE